MPFPSKNAQTPFRVCIVGDSHIGAVKRAVDEGYVPPIDAPVSFDFFGAPGPKFRDLHLQDGRLVASGHLVGSKEFIATSGHTSLDGTEFDAYFFVSARFRTNKIFEACLPGLVHPDVFVSKGARLVAIHRICQRRLSLRAAYALANTGSRYVAVTPEPFATKGIATEFQYPDGFTAAAAGKSERDEIWVEFAKFMGERGVTLICQAEETIVEGCLTHSDWAPADAFAKNDAVHKNSAFAQLLLNDFFQTPDFEKALEDHSLRNSMKKKARRRG